MRASRPDRGGVRTTGQREPPGLTGAGVSLEEQGRALSLRAASAPRLLRPCAHRGPYA